MPARCCPSTESPVLSAAGSAPSTRLRFAPSADVLTAAGVPDAAAGPQPRSRAAKGGDTQHSDPVRKAALGVRPPHRPRLVAGLLLRTDRGRAAACGEQVRRAAAPAWARTVRPDRAGLGNGSAPRQ